VEKRVTSKIVLMYHGLWASDADYENIPAVDRPYAIHSTAFEAQMARVSDLGRHTDVLITFDDGHASARAIAMPILAKYGMVATVFVTTAWTDTQDNYCTTDDLRALKSAGWTIGAHGHTHRFLTTIDDDELESELRHSREALAPYMGDAPEMSFPGGCFGEREIDAARAHGFVVLFGSQPSRWKPQADTVAPRYAVRSSMSLKSFENLLNASLLSRIANEASWRAKGAARRVLGDELYYSVYRLLRS
jgi:peptidoglycan/xylan/chitin deacetylase (PgdA/CDA1 family)